MSPFCAIIFKMYLFLNVIIVLLYIKQVHLLIKDKLWQKEEIFLMRLIVIN